MPQDFAIARHWYEKAAALGNAASMNNLADLYRYGRGVAPDLPAAANWYLKAAKLGLASAMNNLGELSEAGTGVPQNYQAARNWYKKAADLGNADAMGNLGALFESGRGGLPPKADIRLTLRHVCLVPLATERSAAKKLLDHLVGTVKRLRFGPCCARIR